jgi:ribonuclease T1
MRRGGRRWVDQLRSVRFDGVMITPGRRRVLIAGVAVAALALVAVLVGMHRSSGSGQTAGSVTTVLRPTTSASARTSTTRASGATTRAGGIATTTSSPKGPGATAPKDMAVVALAALPPEARHTYQLVQAGGPYPYARDGVVFENREKVLPAEASGYYHEYTVVTPGSSDRGARRLIAGKAGERYYTDDHYATFRFVVPG